MSKPSRDFDRIVEQDTDDVSGHVNPRPEATIEVGDDVNAHCVAHVVDDDDRTQIHRVRVTDDGTEDVSGHVQPRGDFGTDA